jgi:hypothetical protein
MYIHECYQIEVFILVMSLILASWLWWLHKMYCKVFSSLQLFCCHFMIKKLGLGQAQWVMSVILDTWVANIGRIVV